MPENANDSDWRNHGNMGGGLETTGGQLSISLLFSDVAPPLLMPATPKDQSDLSEG